MIRNNKLLLRICQLISQTYATPYEAVLANVQKMGIEPTIEELENRMSIKY